MSWTHHAVWRGKASRPSGHSTARPSKKPKANGRTNRSAHAVRRSEDARKNFFGPRREAPTPNDDLIIDRLPIATVSGQTPTQRIVSVCTGLDPRSLTIAKSEREAATITSSTDCEREDCEKPAGEDVGDAWSCVQVARVRVDEYPRGAKRTAAGAEHGNHAVWQGPVRPWAREVREPDVLQWSGHR